jgi:hypothetical protein
MAPLQAQVTDSRGSAPLPDAPQPVENKVQVPSDVPANEGAQTRRILGIVPNFRAVSVNSHLPPQSTKEKFTGFVQDSFDYSSFIFVGLLSGVEQLQGSSPEFHTGPAAYGRYYWHSFADQTDENLWVEFLLPAALHEDPRYYTLGRLGSEHGARQRHPNGALKRTAYAFSRIVITRTDSGGNNFNFGEVVGAGAASGLSNLYYPASDRSWTKTGQRWALNVGIDGATFVFREFWPDLNRKFFHQKVPQL